MRRIVRITLAAHALLAVAAVASDNSAAGSESASDVCLVFSYFVDNGQDGLHLAYSRDGFHFEPIAGGRSLLTPQVGQDRLMRDPCIIRGADGRFHMVWTVSWKEKGIGYASSPDLVHWSDQRYIPVMEHEPQARNCWAPEVFYDEHEKQYILFWATTIPGRFPETETQGDGGLNHRMYCTMTRDFEEFTPTRLFYDPGFNVIDSTVVRQGDRYIMFLKNETRQPPEKNIRMAFASRPAGPWSAATEPITGDYWAEGPTAVRLGDTWRVYFDKYTQHRYGVVVSDDLENWRDRSDELVMPKGIRHGTILRVRPAELQALLALETTARD